MSLFDINRRLKYITEKVEILIAEKDRLDIENQKLRLENDYLRDKLNLLEELAIQLRSDNETYRKILNA